MAFYTVMIPPPGSAGPRDEIERARLLPERFAWTSLLFTGLWLLGKRLWLATLLFVLVWAALLYTASRFGLPGDALFLCWAAIALFLGLEGNDLVARKLARKGWRLADVVEANSLGEAERRYFERALSDAPAPARPQMPAPRSEPRPAGPLPVIGLFPEARGR